MLSFEFASAARIQFGRGSLAGIGSAAAAFGTRALVICGSEPSRAARLLELLRAAGTEIAVKTVRGEPSFEAVRALLAEARPFDAQVVIGFGGGSVVDSAKAVSALLANPGDPLDYAELIGGGKSLVVPALPCIAIPTTAGTGSEVTRNAVLSSAESQVKVSLRSPTMLPRLALVDPELCMGLPAQVTASTGMDALTQLVEPFVCNRPNPLTDALCREGIRRAASALPRAVASGLDGDAREGMSLAALFSGLALANSRLGLVHGFAAPIGGVTGAAHGAICAALLPAVAAANIRAMREREPSNPGLARYAEVGLLLRAAREAAAGEAEPGAVPPEEAPLLLAELAKGIGIRGLSATGLGKGDFPAVIERAKVASSTQGNPIRLEDRELLEILERSY
ncbi:MAG TPA: iron-containing alcohol dehydrogenase [Rectinemataceae bacterium]|nr:iron-containing alcohol dehydrogenase [Rectinemataceae bacterium]